MIGNSFLIQIGMGIVAVGIFFFFVQPGFIKIGEIQDKIVEYQAETAKVSEVNAKLAVYVNRMNGISSADMRALLTYLPDEIDHVSVSRDIFNMSKESNVYLSQVQYAQLQQDQSLELTTEIKPMAHSFTFDVLGTYQDIKSFLGLFEQNNYPLEVHEARFTATETGLVSVSATVVTYSHSNNI